MTSYIIEVASRRQGKNGSWRTVWVPFHSVPECEGLDQWTRALLLMSSLNEVSTKEGFPGRWRVRVEQWRESGSDHNARGVRAGGCPDGFQGVAVGRSDTAASS